MKTDFNEMYKQIQEASKIYENAKDETEKQRAINLYKKVREKIDLFSKEETIAMSTKKYMGIFSM